MNTNLPPLPPNIYADSAMGIAFQQYARAAIEASRAAVPEGWVLAPMGTLNHWKAQVNQVAALSLKKDRWATGAALKQEIADMIAAAPQPVAQPGEPLLDCDVAPRPLAYPLKDYHHSPSNGPLHFTWQDKPHRIVYDLIAAVRYYAQAKPEQASQQWMPIETAPKDLVILLGYEPQPRLEGSRRVYEGRWHEATNKWGSVNGFIVHDEATHWMPLPAAPQPKD